MRLGIREGGLHRLLGQSVVNSKGSLEHGSMSVTESMRLLFVRNWKQERSSIIACVLAC